ncbi:MAG: Maf family nucleotide pyrophosphatase [Bacteroidaceae bacterium]|nr:Maf family nucleotide pyrophosphatase [Bacteroidaceae bacterium]
MLANLSKYKVLLASKSPRRKELLAGLGIEFDVYTIPKIDESYPSELKGKEIPMFISKQKIVAYLKQMEDNEMIITADTIVYIDGKVLGKPHNKQEAHDMLEMLSGKVHEVITGVSIATKEKQITFADISKVSFANLSEEDINFYIDKYAPFDKAGAYGIQEWIGFIGVNGLEGSYFNVMGLPVQRLYEELLKF